MQHRTEPLWPVTHAATSFRFSYELGHSPFPLVRVEVQTAEDPSHLAHVHRSTCKPYHPPTAQGRVTPPGASRPSSVHKRSVPIIPYAGAALSIQTNPSPHRYPHSPWSQSSKVCAAAGLPAGCAACCPPAWPCLAGPKEAVTTPVGSTALEGSRVVPGVAGTAPPAVACRAAAQQHKARQGLHPALHLLHGTSSGKVIPHGEQGTTK